MIDIILHITYYIIILAVLLAIVPWMIIFPLDIYYSITGQKDKLKKLWYGDK